MSKRLSDIGIIALRGSLVLLASFGLLADAQAAERDITFEADVRPILKAHCFQCHGEAGEKEGQLDLRLRRLVVAGGESGPAVVPNKSSDSLLLKRVRTGEMPPGDKRLSNSDVATIEAWITAGATTARDEPTSIGAEPIFTHEERNWWAFQPVRRPQVPRGFGASAPTPIDALVLSRLGTAGADAPVETRTLSPAAASFTLIRRASFDLLGLPPTPSDVERFDEDDRPDAWERQVDRLLASPFFGERWGRHWLDVAGYADSEGYTDADTVREHAFRYRDYVIRSFNDDKPFNRFIVEQLAGDELAGPGDELTPQRIELLTATGFLRMAPDGTGSSVDQNLARNQVVADTLQIVSTSLLGMTVQCAQCHDHRYDPISQADYYRMRAIFEPALDWKHWKTPNDRRVTLYTAQDRATRKLIEAQAKQVDAKRQQRIDYYITKTLEQELLLIDETLRDALRTAYRTESKKRTADQTRLLDDHPTVAKLSAGALYLYDRRREVRAKDIEAKRAEKESEFLAVAARTHPGVTAESLATINPQAAATLAVYTQAAAEIRSARIADELKKHAAEAAAVRATIPKENFIRTLQESPGQLPETFLFFRGDQDQPRQALLPAGLSILDLDAAIGPNNAELPTSGRRLQFARHLTSGDHPLVARVIVNRIWMHPFGRGLVNSPGDFGVLGERPTHPELLDWLASEFVESGWSVKQMLRRLVTSSTYRQSARGSKTLVERDPENRFYGRQSVRRLEGETLRDAVLAVSGTLNTKLYGEPVPVMEDSVGQIVIGKENLDGERKPTKPIPLNGEEYRRSVYVQVRRTRPLGVLETFDAPPMSPNCDKRAASNVSPQSLLMMNSDFARSFSLKFAERLIAEAGDDPRSQLALGWKLAFGQKPSRDDVASAEHYLNLQRDTIQKTLPDLKADQQHVHALATFCQALMSSSRFLYVE